MPPRHWAASSNPAWVREGIDGYQESRFYNIARRDTH